MSDPAKVLLIPDTAGWAWHHMAKGIAAYAAEPYRVAIAFPQDVAPLGANRSLGYLYGSVFQFSLSEGQFPLDWSLRDGSIVDHPGWFWSQKAGDPPSIACRLTSRIRHRERLFQQAKGCDVLLVKNRQHHRKLEHLGIQAQYVPPAVDTNIFRYQEPRTRDFLVVGWCGQVPTDGSLNQKGAKEVLFPLVEKVRQSRAPVKFLINQRTAAEAFDLHVMARWYAQCDLFLCTSMDEGGPMPILEAMACGRPVVSTTCGFVPDVVRDGETGWLVPQWWSEQDAAQLVDQLGTLICELACDPDLVRQAGEAAAHDVQERWSWKLHANTWLEAITGVAHDA